MDLTDTEAQQFWPIYDKYTSELAAITDTKYTLLQEYAQRMSSQTPATKLRESYIKGRSR